MKHFVLVNAVHLDGLNVRKAAGIRRLKRGDTLADFIRRFAAELGLHENLSLLSRGESMLLARGDTQWCFTAYPEGELLRAAAYLSKVELHRDLRELALPSLAAKLLETT